MKTKFPMCGEASATLDRWNTELRRNLTTPESFNYQDYPVEVASGMTVKLLNVVEARYSKVGTHVTFRAWVNVFVDSASNEYDKIWISLPFPVRQSDALNAYLQDNNLRCSNGIYSFVTSAYAAAPNESWLVVSNQDLKGNAVKFYKNKTVGIYVTGEYETLSFFKNAEKAAKLPPCVTDSVASAQSQDFTASATLTAVNPFTVSLTSANRYIYDRDADKCWVSLYLTFTTGGTASNVITANLPYTSRTGNDQMVNLYINDGAAQFNAAGIIAANTTNMAIYKGNTDAGALQNYPIRSGNIVTGNFCYYLAHQ